MRDTTGHSEFGTLPLQHPRGLVAVVGSRNLVSARIELALRDRFSFEFLDAPPAVISVSDVAALRPSLYVVNCYRALDVGGMTPKSAQRAAEAMADSIEDWMAKWTQRIAELQQLDPAIPIVVTLNEQHDSAMVSRAIAAGADEVIGAAVADVPQLVRQRVWSLLVDTDSALADSLRDDNVAFVAPMMTSPMAAPAGPAPDAQHGWPHNRRRSIGRRKQDADHPAAVIAESWEPPINARDAAAAMQRVRGAIPSLPSAAQRSGPLADLMQVRAPSLRAPSGRVDAGRVAERLGVSVSRLAGSLQVSRQALSEMPDSPKAQKALDPFARALSMLDELLPNEKTVRAWLVSPNQRLAGATPQEAMLGGRAEEVARALEMMRDGGLGA